MSFACSYTTCKHSDMVKLSGRLHLRVICIHIEYRHTAEHVSVASTVELFLRQNSALIMSSLSDEEHTDNSTTDESWIKVIPCPSVHTSHRSQTHRRNRLVVIKHRLAGKRVPIIRRYCSAFCSLIIP